MTVCLSFFIPINQLTILSSVAIAGGLYFFVLGFQLLARKRLLLATPTSKVRSAALGLVEVNGIAAGPHTMPAPITGKPCFLYHTTAWQQRADKKQEWEKVADETLHLPFFIDDGTGQLLIEPLGADLDLRRDFREEYASSFFSSTFFSNEANVPPRISVFLSRHGVVLARRLRIEERLIKPEDALFIAGTLTENPGVEVRPFSPRDVRMEARMDDSRTDKPHYSAADNSAEQLPAPQVIKLQSGAAPSTTQEMSQQAKIAAALTRAGITRPEAWSAAGVPYQSVAVDENAPPAPVSAHDERRLSEVHPRPNGNDQPQPSAFNLTPLVVLMKGANNPTFVISFRSQKEFVSALGWKSGAMVWGGAAITLLGLYMLLMQMELL
ncbi:MAG TPA: GIDE domain-containing protein [Terriglobales bacterium]|nr:GIDE domain-containing protein [Terriglobales bacterium]